MEKVSKIQIGCEKYDIQDKEARQLIEDLQQRDIFEDIRIDATVDLNIGNANVFVNKTEEGYTFNFTGIKGEAGSPGQDGRDGRDGKDGKDGVDGRDGHDGQNGSDGVNGVTPNISAYADIGNTIGVPNVDVSVSGTPENPVFNFHFDGLRGKDGADGKDGTNGTNGRDGVDGRDGRDGTNGSNSDNTELWNKINSIERDLANKWDQIDSKVEGNVNRIITESEWLDTLLEGIQSGSTFGDDDVDLYLQRIGLYTKSGNTRTWAWSTILQDVNNLSLRVDNLQTAISTGTDPEQLESLESSLELYIDGKFNTAMTNLHTQYARKDAETVIEWMYSELTQGANSELTWNEIVSAAKGENNNGAISRVKTNIAKLANDEYLATANLVSAITTKKVDIANVLMDSSVLSSAGVLTSADLENASSTLYSKLGQKYAAIDTVVTKGSNGAIESGVTIKADQIDLQGHTFVDLLTATEKGNLVSNGLSTLSGQTVTVDANGVHADNGQGSAAYLYPGGINFGSSGAGTNYISNGALQIGYLSYAVGNNTLSAGNITTGGNIDTYGDITLKDPSYERKITSEGLLKISAGGTLSLRASDISIGDSNTENTYIGGNTVYLGTSASTNTIVASTAISSSDERVKNIIEDINVSVEDIAATRIVNYAFKENPSNVRTGSIAQDWQAIIPNAVKIIDSEDHLGLDYSAVSIVSAVVDAREIVKLKQENEELKQRLYDIEQRLANL